MRTRLVPALLLAIAATAASAQPETKKKDEVQPLRQQQRMSQDDRQRMRDDMRDAYRGRPDRPQKARQMSPEERGKLRRDIEDANRSLKR